MSGSSHPPMPAVPEGVRRKFQRYDMNQDHAIDAEELAYMLDDLGPSNQRRTNRVLACAGARLMPHGSRYRCGRST